MRRKAVPDPRYAFVYLKRWNSVSLTGTKQFQFLITITMCKGFFLKCVCVFTHRSLQAGAAGGSLPGPGESGWSGDRSLSATWSAGYWSTPVSGNKNRLISFIFTDMRCFIAFLKCAITLKPIESIYDSLLCLETNKPPSDFLSSFFFYRMMMSCDQELNPQARCVFYLQVFQVGDLVGKRLQLVLLQVELAQLPQVPDPVW